MKTNVKIGTCGFRANKTEYAAMLAAVEVQHTFYQPPQIKTLEKWRAEVPENFEFALKAWQLITHEAKSPTYKRLKKTLTETERAEAGYFKPTPIVREGWETTLACARALRARTVLFQCPASFRQNQENIENLEKFFGTIERENLIFAWEPRGDWNPKIVKDICVRLDLCHAVDPFAVQTVTPERCYYRLHGRTGFRYQYEEDELGELAGLLPADETSYVFFNNRYMLEDALSFRKIIKEY
ncbi:MAG TPA: DUF72 domain-containing protein [Pyrinomonadaceae bacterium]|jgi:uncharacterized protein YecE (DUF72 family)